MSGTRYRRGRDFAADMAVYVRDMAESNSEQMGRLRRNVMLALREDVTPGSGSVWSSTIISGSICARSPS